MAESRSYAFDVTGKGLRALYGEISERIISGIAGGGRRFHAVFPPGTDRGRIVSVVMSNTRLKTLIVSPNAARRQYWKARRAHHADLYDAAASTWTNVPGQMVSTNPYSCAPVITLTYKQLAESRTAGQEQEAMKRFTTHAARQGYKLVILDECTDLPGTWKDDFLAFVKEADAVVIGFSNAMPDDTSAWFSQCKEAVKLEVPVTVAALQGALAPYRHHVLFHKHAAAVEQPERYVQAAGKIEPALEIAAGEFRRHGQDARIAVMLDSRALTHVRADGLLDGISVLRALTSRPETSAHTAVMLSGASIIVPTPKQQDIAAAIQREARNREWDLGLQLRANDEFSEISGEKKDWNTSTYVELVRMLMRQGLARCVLLAPDILSWGIQQMPFNTVIDLTSGRKTRYMHVPETPMEVAVKTADASVNYWDIVCLSPTGGPDWERFFAKHDTTECPTEDNVIEIGPGAVDMRLPSMNPLTLLEDIPGWNAAHLERSINRKDWAGVWKRTESAGALSESLVIVPWDEFPAAVHCEAVVRDLLAEDARIHTQRKATMKLHHTLWTVVAVSGALIGFLTLSREVGMYVSGGALLVLILKILTKWWSVRGARPRVPLVPREEFLYRAALAVYAAYADSVEGDFPDPEDAVHMSPREDGTYRVLYTLPDESAARACRTAFMEVLSAQDESPYMLTVQAFNAGNKTLQRILASEHLDEYYSPQYRVRVPSYFTQSRAHAELFRASWEEFAGHALLYTASDSIPEVPTLREAYPASVRVAWCRQ